MERSYQDNAIYFSKIDFMIRNPSIEDFSAILIEIF